MRFREGGVRTCLRPKPVQGGQNARGQAGGSGTQKNVQLPSQYRRRAGRFCTLPRKQFEAVDAAGDRALRRERCSPRRRRPGSPTGALLPSPQETGALRRECCPLVAGDRALRREHCSPRRRRPGSPSGELFPSLQETGLSVGSAAPFATGDRGSPSGALLSSSQEAGFSVGSAAPLAAEDQALRLERCSPRRRRTGSPSGALRLRRTTVKGKIGIYTKK
ncbi:hypothetical protein NDU88_002977 [Pleurodeles waltl]|uniref:Uncharacterized protein n=1 Tax=Pleurodeles waltl TaxID=8319 RepID=A0AAV7PAR9_PLEWA|nr:hypothetical protein NDU88_002977 [Pleurodeles waltl]